jgi:predicted RNA-binding Zn ribbon-like protein
LVRARELREALHGAFSALAGGGSPDLDLLRITYAEAVAAATLTVDGFDWPRSEPHRVRFAVATDAVALITDPERASRLHRCPGRDCGWVFLDTSGRRRWCSMDTCGSREKMRRMYARRKALLDDA